MLGSGRHGVLGSVAGVEQAAHVAGTVRGRALNLDQLRLLGIGLQHRVSGKAGLLQVRLHPGHRIIRFRAHRFIHHHLQHQVNAALEVQTKVDAVGQRRLPGRRAYALRNAEDAKDEHEKNCNDQEGFTHGTQFFRRADGLPRNTVI